MFDTKVNIPVQMSLPPPMSNMQHVMDYIMKTPELLPMLWMVFLAVPMIFPDVFFKRKNYESYKNSKNKMIFFDVRKESENPFTEEPTEVRVYDPETQELFTAMNVYDDDDYEGLIDFLKEVTRGKDMVYFVTFDDGLQVSCFKSLLGEYVTNSDEKEFRFLDTKHLFYAARPFVPQVSYDDVREYYRVPELEYRPLETCAIMEQILEDHEVKIDNRWDKVSFLYEEVYA